ncbi:MAG: lysostaphin resistance A-like protein [Solirubrobacterales bacterium]
MSDDLTDSPPAKTGADAWPWYYSLTAFIAGFVVAQVFIVFLFAFWAIAGGDAENDTWFTVFASAINSVVFVAAAVFIARLSGPVTARDFGLIRAPFGQALGKSIAIMVSYFIVLAIYNQLVNLTPDDAPEELGANAGILGMFAFAVLVAVVAPFAEEIFYRGMVFRALANGVGVWLAAIISGVLFGAVHINSLDGDRLLQVVPLGLLGILFAILYVWAGTLYAPIALHATNNALAVLVYAEKQDSTFGMILSGVLWLLMMVACTVGWRLTDRDRGGMPPTLPPEPSPTAAQPKPYVAPSVAPSQSFLRNPERPESQ